MSLHAQLSPEAQARFNRQKKNSTITSIIIALLGMALISVILLYISLKLMTIEIPPIVSYNAGLEEKVAIDTKPRQPAIKRNPSAPAISMAKVLVSQSVSPTAVPVPEIDVPDPANDFGDGNDFGSGFADGNGKDGDGFNNLDPSIGERCSLADRLSRLAQNGGNEQCEDAVVKGLQWLKKTQNADGSWSHSNKVAMTGFALLAYMGHCETAQSPEFGTTVLKGISYLTNIAMKNEGKMTEDLNDKHWCYEHAVATYALAECYSLCVKAAGENIPELDKAVLMSGQFIIANQHKSGGWDYAYDTYGKRGGDTSIAGWHVQALKAAKITGLEFKGIDASARKALEYFETKQNDEGSIGYTSPNIGGSHSDTTLTAVGALCFQMWDKASASLPRKACKYLDENIKLDWNGADSDLYGHYYAAQAMINYGGDYWERYNENFRDQTLNNQNADGSWKTVGGGQPIKAVGAQFVSNTHYRTCLAILMLETYYRFLPGSH